MQIFVHDSLFTKFKLIEFHDENTTEQNKAFEIMSTVLFLDEFVYMFCYILSHTDILKLIW